MQISYESMEWNRERERERERERDRGSLTRADTKQKTLTKKQGCETENQTD